MVITTTTIHQKREEIPMVEQLIAIFCDIDDFCIEYEKYLEEHLLTDEGHKTPKTSMEMSYIMTIAVFFHLSNQRYFKWYYKNFICGDPRVAGFFGKLVSYNRFVELMPTVAAPITLYLMKHSLGKCSGISFLDSTTIDVCDVRRMYSHKVFAGLAKKGKSSTGWFFGFKLHITINDKGEIIAFCLTTGNVDDRDWNVISKLTKQMFGKVFADRGYISAPLFAKLYSNGIQLITKLKKNMKNKLMHMTDKILLRKRAVIESVNDFLKNVCQIEHSRHRSVANFIVNIISALVAYSFLPTKPSLNIVPNFDFCSAVIAA